MISLRHSSSVVMPPTNVAIFDFDSFIWNTMLCSIEQILNTLQATERKYIHEGHSRDFTCIDILSIRQRLIAGLYK